MFILGKHFQFAVVALLCAAVWSGCGSSKTGSIPTAETAFASARAKVLAGDYLDAETDLNIIKLQYAGSAHADSVQFLLGDCNYHEEKYLLAAYEYGAVRRSFPNSPLNRQAQFNVAESYYKLSPPASVDQEYTNKAVEEYQSYLEMYGRRSGADDSLVEQASNRIKELRERLGKKCFETAELYTKMTQFKASNIYCDNVLEKFYDTQYADKAYVLKIRNLIDLKHFTEALHEIEKFLVSYRTSALVPDVRQLRESIEQKMSSTQ